MFILVQARCQQTPPQELPAELQDKTVFEVGKLGWFEVVEPTTIPSFDPETEMLIESNYDLDFNTMQAVKIYTVQPKYTSDNCPTCVREYLESDDENRGNNVVRMSLASGKLITANTI